MLSMRVTTKVTVGLYQGVCANGVARREIAELLAVDKQRAMVGVPLFTLRIPCDSEVMEIGRLPGVVLVG